MLLELYIQWTANDTFVSFKCFNFFTSEKKLTSLIDWISWIHYDHSLLVIMDSGSGGTQYIGILGRVLFNTVYA